MKHFSLFDERCFFTCWQLTRFAYSIDKFRPFKTGQPRVHMKIIFRDWPVDNLDIPIDRMVVRESH